MTTHSEQLDQLATALAKAQAQVTGAKKDAANPFYKSKYADLASVWDACREALTSNGLSVVQFPESENGEARLTTYLLHSSGQWMRGTAGAPLVKADPQGMGSALTYLRRYALAAVTSVAPEDDDGNDASGRTMQKPKTTTPAAKPPVVSLSEPPPALQVLEPPMPWEPPTDLTPCPHTKEGKTIAVMTRGELAKLQAWLMLHPEAEAAEEWAAVVKLALAKRAA